MSRDSTRCPGLVAARPGFRICYTVSVSALSRLTSPWNPGLVSLDRVALAGMQCQSGFQGTMVDRLSTKNFVCVCPLGGPYGLMRGYVEWRIT